MKTIAFIIPYIGKLPNWFASFLITCSYNKSIDFLLFIDDHTEFDYPDNVKAFFTTFDDLKKIIKRNFDIPINISRPYKFCDFKPAYGEIFSSYLYGYDFWGHCDIDLLWGDIRAFVTEEVLSKYDRIYTHGHCCIYRNIPKVNAWYRTLPSLGCQDWKTVITSDKSCCFDEWAGHLGGGLSQIIKNNGIICYDEIDMADLNRLCGWFKSVGGNLPHNFYLHFSEGKLYACKADKKIEVIYAHFQKRPIIISEDYTWEHSDFFINAPGIIETKVKRHIEKSMLFTLNVWYNRILHKLKDVWNS